MRNNISTSGLAGLESRLSKIKPGSKVELIIGIDRSLSSAELSSVAQELGKSLNLADQIQLGATREWPNAIKMTFYNPVKQGGYSLLPIAVLIIGALGVVGVSAFLGWKLGTIFESIGKYIVPITLIVTGGFVLYGFATRKR